MTDEIHNPQSLSAATEATRPPEATSAAVPSTSNIQTFFFIQNRIDVDCDVPVEVVPGHFLQKANNVQVRLIKEQLLLVGAIYPPSILYECAIVPTGENTNGRYPFRTEPLPQEEWRYWVINCNGPNIDQTDLEIAADLLQQGLYIGMMFAKWTGETGGFGWNRGFAVNYYRNFDRMTEPVVQLGLARLREIGGHFAQLKISKDKWPNHYSAAHRFHYLRDLHDQSDFMVIGLFSAIESLITHAPKLTEPMDSLTHQMKTKMSLLRNRFQRPLDYEPFFGIRDGDKVWGKLYEYRSLVAHGEQPNFETVLKLLRSSQNAIAFLREAAKLLILQALNEPQLIADLKNC